MYAFVIPDTLFWLKRIRIFNLISWNGNKTIVNRKYLGPTENPNLHPHILHT
jgi:hypothetical protein